ncbi:hypothetical protein MHYP_G00219250 [Metynnis hypsauchen]
MKEGVKKGAQLVLGFVSAGVAKGVQSNFHCPCDESYTLLFFFVYLLGPAIAMLIFGILILRQNNDWNFGSRCYGCFFSCLVPPVVWAVMFFTGKYKDCFKDNPKEGPPQQFLDAVCKMEFEFYTERAGEVTAGKICEAADLCSYESECRAESAFLTVIRVESLESQRSTKYLHLLQPDTSYMFFNTGNNRDLPG